MILRSGFDSETIIKVIKRLLIVAVAFFIILHIVIYYLSQDMNKYHVYNNFDEQRIEEIQDFCNLTLSNDLKVVEEFYLRAKEIWAVVIQLPDNESYSLSEILNLTDSDEAITSSFERIALSDYSEVGAVKVADDGERSVYTYTKNSEEYLIIFLKR